MYLIRVCFDFFGHAMPGLERLGQPGGYRDALQVIPQA